MFKNLSLLAGFSAFVVFAIIALNIYHTRITSTIPDATKIKSAPIDPTFDMQTLENLKKRNGVTIDLTSRSGVITQDEIDATQGGTLTTPTPSITPKPVSGATQQATQSGTPQITQTLTPTP